MVILIVSGLIALLFLLLTFAALAPVYRRLGDAVHGERNTPPSVFDTTD